MKRKPAIALVAVGLLALLHLTPVYAFSIPIVVSEAAADQAATVTHTRSGNPQDGMTITNSVENQAVTIDITITIMAGEGASVDFQKEKHTPAPDHEVRAL